MQRNNRVWTKPKGYMFLHRIKKIRSNTFLRANHSHDYVSKAIFIFKDFLLEGIYGNRFANDCSIHICGFKSCMVWSIGRTVNIHGRSVYPLFQQLSGLKGLSY